MTGFCQRCGEPKPNWVVREAQFNVGDIDHWKVQLCEDCTTKVQQAVLAALRPLESSRR